MYKMFLYLPIHGVKPLQVMQGDWKFPAGLRQGQSTWLPERKITESQGEPQKQNLRREPRFLKEAILRGGKNNDFEGRVGGDRNGLIIGLEDKGEAGA